MDNGVAEARKIDWFIERACDLFSASSDRGTEATERRMCRDVVLQAEEIVRLIVGIAATNAGAILRDITERG
jgi:hypothetical protein